MGQNLDESVTGPTDLELVEAVRKGDSQAYGTLVDRHLRSVYGVALRILGNAADADDVSQDAFLRAFERFDLFDPRWSLRNWLLKIASNLAINRIRSQGREHRLHLKLAEAEEPPGEPETTEVPSPREWAHWLSQIDEAHRTAIVLFHFQNMPYSEIADVLQVPVNTVRTYLYRGRKRLRELMTHRQTENGTWTAAM
jgi:RNA polymerase sigma-70 factor, ECF subfamily